MALFRKSRRDADAPTAEPEATEATETDVAEPEADAPQEPAKGPFDASDVTERGARVDLGAIWLPGVPGMELRMEVDKKTQRINGAACTVDGSGLEVKAFAAPRTMGIWDEIRSEIAASVTKQGGTVDDLPGPFGRELVARLPVVTPEGRSTFRPVRFIGVDGPRWFLRGVLTGKAAMDPKAAQVLESVFAGIVVIRDNSPRPPRDLLALHLPGSPTDGQAGSPEGTPSFDPLERGPEITEIR